MIRTISHTSNSGSTFLAAKLSKSLPAYGEPFWTHDMCHVNQNEMISIFHNNFQDGSIVKFPSVASPIVKHLEGKHVFVYHTAYQHLVKKTSRGVKSVIGSRLFYEDCMIGRENKNIPQYSDVDSLGSCLLYPLSYWWSSKVLDMLDAKNVLWVNANILYSDTENTCKQICDFLEVDYVPVEISYHVKTTNEKYTTVMDDSQIVIDENRNKDPEEFFDPKDSIIDFQQRGNEHIIDAVEWIRDTLEFTDNQLLYGF